MAALSLRVGRWIAIAVLELALPNVLSAQDSTADRNHLYDTFQVGVAFTTVLNYSNARLDASNGEVGTVLNLRDLLGVPGTSIQPAIGLRWKPGRHTEFDLGFQLVSQNGDNTVNDTLVISGDTVSGDLALKFRSSADNATFQFKYSILAKEKYNVGLALGFGVIFFDMSLDASGGVCSGTGGNCVGDSLSVSKQLTIPTASLGVFGAWRVGDRWYVGGDARAIGAEVDRYDFTVFEGDVRGEYYLSNRWGLSLAWYYTDVSMDIAPKSDGSVSEDLVGNLAYNYSSIRLGAVYAF